MNFKINFDGLKNNRDKAGAGYNIRGGSGNLIVAGAVNYGDNLIIVYEVIGLREEVRIILNIGFINIQIESNNICIVNFFKREWTIP